jgi:hypothetical protein
MQYWCANGARAALAVCVIGSAAALAIVALVSTYVSFPVVVVIAMGWCMWLERHSGG